MAIREEPEAAEQVLTRTMDEPDYPDSFFLLGREWDLHRDVFPGTITAATEVMASILPYPPGGSFLEVGSGTGVISVTAALSGCAHVTAVDINPRAVANTAANARRHGVEDIVRALHSDLFQALQPADRYDAIFWNVPWTYVAEDFPMSSELHGAVFDPGYKGQEAYISGARCHLAEGGRLLIGTADLGDRQLLDQFAAKAGMRVELLRRVRRIEVQRVMEYHLLDLHEK
ncbi:methyltransferase [Saccharopolyspora phatthalungensis]|uniref:Methylase of polypeptide subunit release factors n=1 Tax=Saccharopolyspora phatthalungensis TaxID=664693 RepID=A0A840QEF8_9PSEU|nr:methyltransferase [Saccharopolyspora phatthalungensis]MBB5158407.1 methylase of polypeptide subunit release factors [Saccharopolyspora phatthalungensis]